MRLNRYRATGLSLLIGAAFAVDAPAQAQLSGPEPTNKLLLTNGATSLEGSSGGGLATWAVIAGISTRDQLGISGHTTIVELPDYGLRTFGASVGIRDRLELSYTRQNFDTRDVGAALGLGQGFQFNQDIFGAKLRLFGDAVYGNPVIPQVAIGVHHKRNLDGHIVRAVGAASANGTEFYVSATKLILSRSILASGTVRLTDANQGGLLGFGTSNHSDSELEFEGSLAYQISRRLVVGGEFRSRPNNLAIATENDAYDVFAAWAVNRNLTVTGAYADLGSIAGQDGQRGAYLQLQIAF